MGGLAGVWNLDGQPADRSLVTSIASTLAHRGSNEPGIWCDGPIGFAAQLLRVAPQSIRECQPARDRFGTVLLFDGRLDNRDELLARLPRGETTSASPDSAVVLAARCEWGDGFLARLEGDFALALFDPRLHTLVLARDAVGCRPLYYWTNGARLVFGSAIKAILAHPDVRAKPNEDLLADYFLLERLPYEDEGDTFFDGIHAVRPGCWLRVTPGRTSAGRFWDFDPRAQIRYASYPDYALRLRELLVTAVRRRLRTVHPVVIATSGGLDSSIVLCIADDLRRSGALDVALHPVSYAPRDDPTTEENRFMALLESARGLRIHRLAPGDPDDEEQLTRDVRYSESPVFDDGSSAQAPLLVHAGALGARTLLTGIWSDQFFFVTGYLTDLTMKLAWREVARHLDEYNRWFPDADPAYFRNRFRRELLLNATPRAIRRWLRPFRTAMARSHVRWPIGDAVAARVRRRRRPLIHPRYATVHARTIYQTVRAKSHRLEIESDAKIASGCGLAHVTPFLDRDVIAYLMSVPGEVLNRDGVPRALLRDAMDGIVPADILRRTWRDDGPTPAALERERRRTDLAAKTGLRASHALGYFPDARCADADSVDLIGLEVWSQVFFSDTLPPPEEGPRWQRLRK